MESPGIQSLNRRLADKFAALCNESDSIPDVDVFLQEHADATTSEKTAVLLVDQSRRWRQGSGVPAEAYFEKNPDVGAKPEFKLELVIEEFGYQADMGHKPNIEAFVTRFPDLASSLRERLSQDEQADESAPRPLKPARASEFDATLSYSFGRPDGEITAAMDPAGLSRLSSAFGPGVLLNDRYVIERELGRGGMGVVYLGRDERLNRPVAIKVILIRGQLTHWVVDEQMEEAFRAEARIAASLTHPAIATVFDYGFHDGAPYAVFEYLPGQTLRQFMRQRGRVPLEDVRLVIGHIAEALDSAHTHHIVHRDLKPSNIRATAEGNFKVLDLGLAKEFHGEVNWRHFAGTPAYASPEQAACLACDGRTDQYALALIAYEMLTGERVFHSTDPNALLEMHRSTPPAQISDRLSEFPETICEAITRALRKAPNERFATCADFAVSMGAQMVDTTLPDAEVLRETDVERMSRWWRLLGWIPWARYKTHLILTHDAIWMTYYTEVIKWPLASIVNISPRLDPSDKPDASFDGDAAAIRRACCRHEEFVISLGKAHFVLAVASVVGVALVSTGVLGSVRVTLAALVGWAVALGFGIYAWAVGRGLCRLRPWTRIAAIVESAIVLLAFSNGVLLAFFASAQTRETAGTASCLLTPLAPIAAYILWVLISRKGSMVFSKSYREIITKTPELGAKRPRFEFFLAHKRILKLRIRNVKNIEKMALRFPTKVECESWSRALHTLRTRPSSAQSVQSGEPIHNRVVLLHNRPNIRSQLLGSIDAKAEKRRMARAALQIRGAMIGADAIVDVKEERLPEFHRTIRRVAGTAVRAVDEDGRCELRARWYMRRIGSLSVWMIVLVLISFANMLIDYVSAAGSLLVALVHTWPIMIVSLLGMLRWPQLVLPSTLTIVALGGYPIYGVIGHLVGLVLGSEASVAVIYLFNVVSLALLLFSLFLGRMAWRSYREFQHLVPFEGRHVSALRRFGATASWLASGLFAVLFAFLIALSWASVGD